MTEKSIAHQKDGQARQFYPDGLAPWRDATPPDVMAGKSTGSLRSCQFCGSMHPADLAAAIKAGATVEWADWKYGWPHKLYVNGVPNPHAGLDEARMTSNRDFDGATRIALPRYSELTGKRVEDYVNFVKVEKAAATTWGKFYTVHLQDAAPEDREVIERAMGLRFTFESHLVKWEKFAEAQHPAVAAMQPLDNDGKPIDPEAAADTQDAS